MHVMINYIVINIELKLMVTPGLFQKLGYFPEALLNLLTNMGSGFDVRETAGMIMEELISHVSKILEWSSKSSSHVSQILDWSWKSSSIT